MRSVCERMAELAEMHNAGNHDAVANYILENGVNGIEGFAIDVFSLMISDTKDCKPNTKNQ